MLGVRRWLSLASGLLENLMFGGNLFGWTTLVYVLKTENYFSSNHTGTNNTTTTTTTTGSRNQDEMFSLVFIIASSINNLMALPCGFLLDRYGTTVSRLLAILLYTSGTLMMAFSSAALSFLLFPALSLMAAGGIMFMITNMQVGNLFGSHCSAVIILFIGAYDSSSGVFLIIKLLHQVRVSLRSSFLFLSACSVVQLLRTFFLMPRKHFPYPIPDGYTYGVRCGRRRPSSDTELMVDVKTLNQDQVHEVPERSVCECVLSRLFLLHLVWVSVLQLRMFFFLGTLNPKLQRLAAGEASLVSHYTNVFAFIQLSGFLFAPLNGLMVTRHRGRPLSPGQSQAEADLQAMVLSLAVTVLLALIFSICISIPNLQLQYASFILQVLLRVFLYGGHAAFISVAFPLCHYGKLYGLVLAVAGLFSLLQYGCLAIINGPLHGDPLYMNVALTLLCLLAFMHPVSVSLHCRRLNAQRSSSRELRESTLNFTEHLQ